MKEQLCQWSVIAIRWMAHPLTQILTIGGCLLWLVSGLGVDPLTLALSIWAIVLSLMILTNQQLKDEADARRDTAIQAKLDGLLEAVEGARQDLERAEELDVDQIEALRTPAPPTRPGVATNEGS